MSTGDRLDRELTYTEFDAEAFRTITRDRLRHFDEMNLPIAGRRVLDVCSGVGRLAEHLVKRGAGVTCVDGRPENLAVLKNDYPEIEAVALNVETDDLSILGTFDVVFSYGTLYHLADPFAFLRNISGVCLQFAIVETCIIDTDEPVVKLVREPPGQFNALERFGCRPSPSYIEIAARRAGFTHLYAPIDVPDHPDFRFAWQNNYDDERDGRLLREIFVLSKQPLANPSLLPR